MIDFKVTDEQLLLQHAVLETAKDLDHDLSFTSKWKRLAETGIIGTCVDTTYSGLGLSAVDQLLLFEALGEGNTDNGLSFALAAHTLACVIPISLYGTPEQKEGYLPNMINGTTIAANAMTETESGSNAFDLKCVARKYDQNYILNGAKVFVTNSHEASLFLTYALTDSSKGMFGGISAFIVAANNCMLGQKFEKMGLDSCSLGEVVFDDSMVTEKNMLGEEGGGALIFNHSMTWERVCMAGIHIGAMKRILKKTVEFVKQRKSGHTSISKFQAISHPIADMKVLLETSNALALKGAWSIDHKKNVGLEAAMTKLFVSNSLRKFMLIALQIFGGNGYIRDLGIEKEVRDSLASTIYSGTSEIQKNIIASNLDL